MRLLGPLCAVLCAKIAGTPSAAAPDPEERPLLTRFIRSAAAALGLLALAACDLPTLPTSGAVDPAKPVTVALLVPLGSGDAQREALAQSLVNAAKLASGDLQGVELDLKVYATAGDQAQAATAAQTAIDEGAEVILGPLFGTAATAVAPIAAGRGVQVLSFSNNVQIAGGNLYILGSTFENTARRIVSYARGQGIADLGIVHPEGIEGEQGRDAVALAAQAAGARIVATGSYPLSVQGITQNVPDIARNLRASGANAVVLTDGPTSGLTFVAETLRGLGVRDEQVRFMGLQRWDTSPQAIAQPGLQGGWFAAPDPVVTAQFNSRYSANFGGDPHPLASLAYDGVAAIGAVVAEARAENARDPFSAARLTRATGFAGVTGIFRLFPDGRNERGLAVFEVVDGTADMIDPAPRQFGAGGS